VLFVRGANFFQTGQNAGCRGRRSWHAIFDEVALNDGQRLGMDVSRRFNRKRRDLVVSQRSCEVLFDGRA